MSRQVKRVNISGKEDKSNKVINWSSTTTDAHYPSEKLVKDSLDGKANSTHNHTKSQITDFPTSMTPSSHTHGNLQNNGQVGSTAQASKNVVTDSSGKITTEDKPTIPSASSTTPSADTTNGSVGTGTTWARSNHTHPKSSLYAEATHNHTKSQITDFPSIPSKTSDLQNDSGFLTSHQDISGKIDTAGTGLSKSGTTLNHSNSITAQTTNVFKKFKYDAQGHITGTTSVAASDLPSHTHTSSQISDLSIPSASTTLPSVDTANGSYGTGTTWARSNHSHPKSSIYAEASHIHSTLDIKSPTRPWSNFDDYIPDDTTQDDINIAIDDVLTLKEDKGNKVTSLSSSSTDTQYPSAKTVYDNISPYTYDSGWVACSTFMNTNVQSYDSNHPHRIRRIGKVVHMEGIVKNNNTFGGDNDGQKISGSGSGLPTQFRPSNHQYSLQQGNGNNKFLLHVYPNGDIYLERYGTTSNINVSSGSWLHMNMTWFVD